MRKAAGAIVGVFAVTLTGCGLHRSTSALAITHHPSHQIHIQKPKSGHITKMGTVASRLTVVQQSNVPTWTFETAKKTWRAKVPQGPNTIIVAPDYPMGALWSELESAQRYVKRSVTLVAVGWPQGTTFTQAQATMAQITADYHLHWPVDYVLQPVKVPSPLTVLVRGAKERVLTGLLPSAHDWVSLLNSNSL